MLVVALDPRDGLADEVDGMKRLIVGEGDDVESRELAWPRDGRDEL